MKKSRKSLPKSRRRTGPQQSKNLSVKLRFLPAIIISVLATILAAQPQTMHSPLRDVLAYATNTTVSGLLSATNTQRTNNGVGALTGNSQLNSAAQAKANDMVTRDYWSHNTPDGQEPWVFISNAGYSFSAAGENLAYGYMTSDATVTGWMTSTAGHKENMLSGNFTEVGFGIANSPNFNDSGQQTVVVALYAKPKASQPAAQPSAATAPKKSPAAPAAQPKAATPAAAPAPVEPEPTPEPEPEEEIIAITATANEPPTTAAPAQTRRIQLFNAQNALLSTTAVILSVGSIGILWLIHKGIRLRRYLLAGEHFVTRHFHIDLAVLSVIYLGFVLLSSSGYVR